MTFLAGDTVRLIGTDRIYTVVSVQTYYEGMKWETQWATLTRRLPPIPPIGPLLS